MRISLCSKCEPSCLTSDLEYVIPWPWDKKEEPIIPFVLIENGLPNIYWKKSYGPQNVADPDP